MEETFLVKTENFEGPFEVLLDLIEDRKLSINEVSLAEITDDYLSHIKKIGGLSVRDLSAFIVVAATLMLIKSKTLLPNLELTEEEKMDMSALEHRLVLFQKFRALESGLKKKFGKLVLHTKPEQKTTGAVFAPGEGITKDLLQNTLETVIASIPKKFAPPEAVIKKIIHIEEVINSLLDRIGNGIKLSLSGFAGEFEEKKTYLIIAFLAILELIKTGALSVNQKAAFEDIYVEKTSRYD